MRDSVPAPAMIQVGLLTNEFVRRFRQRIGEEPSLDLVNRLLAASKRIRRQQTLYKRINGEFHPYRFLSEWWNHAAGMILIVDEHDSVAITVVTPNDTYPERPRPPRRPRFMK